MREDYFGVLTFMYVLPYDAVAMEIEIEIESKKDERKTHRVEVGTRSGGGTSTRLPDGILLSASKRVEYSSKGFNCWDVL